MAEYKLTFARGAFNASDISGITKNWKLYTSNIKKMNGTVKSLDRYDDFATMKVGVGQYKAKSEDSKYGIPFDRAVHGETGNVVAKHQYNAAHAFLQKLRGFGLLADVVGSGKTFEACTVLAELAARGAINSMLLIVPRQVLEEWVRVLENRFGLGEKVLFRYPDLSQKDENGNPITPKLPKWDDLMTLEGGVYRPKRPIIVAMEDFLKWDEAMNNCLYDVVVVDEAHHLCDRNNDDYSGSMYRLSCLMKIKREHNKPYCLLLSATPHSGDLEKMFRLWYFIRCKGGDPNDFRDDDKNIDDSAGNHTAYYNHELACYQNEICRGAKTVFDFINKAKIGELVPSNSPYRDKLIHYYDTREVDGERPTERLPFDSLTETQKVDVINEFLEEHLEIKDEVLKNVANSYHNGVLRSIMIRNPKSASARLNGRSKCAKNIFLVPSAVTEGIKEITFGSDKLSLDIGKLGDLNGNFLSVDGKRTTLREYVKETRTNETESARKANILNTVLKNVLNVNDNSFTTNDIKRYGAYNYYYTQMRNLPRDIDTILSPEKSLDFESVFESKMRYLKEILATHDSARVLIFFDYELRGRNKVQDRVEEALKNDKRFKNRLLCATKKNKLSINAEFNKKEDAILLAKDASVTEGTNLQASSIVINFQVTPDPVAMEQRIGRVFRMGQQNNVTIYSLADMTALEGYVLMYFSRIGLMSSNSGDATIIAGSNNNNMVTVRCKRCENAILISRDEYENAKLNNSPIIYCDKTPVCRDPYLAPNGTLMTEISTIDFQCSNPNCSAVFERSAEGYECMSHDKEVMCSSAENRNVYCHKMCSISHCRKFMDGGEYEDCAALKLYKEMGRNANDADLAMCCQNCTNRCPEKCRFSSSINDPEKSINRCTDCPEASCYPTPGVLSFDKNWEASCPVCEGIGKLRPVVARTFPTYVRSLWDFRFDPTAFCKNLRNEANRVASISDILEKDDQYDD